MKRQRGQAFILVLILLALGALMISPVLKYTYTALVSQRISETSMTVRYGGDAALADGLWQMLQSIQGGGSPNLTAYDFVYATGRNPVSVNITRPEVPPSQQLATSNTPRYLMLEAQPNWLDAKSGNLTINYILRIQSQPWSPTLVTNFEVTLPKGLFYIDNSTWSRGPGKEAGLVTASVNFTAHTVLGLAMTRSPGFAQDKNYYEVYGSTNTSAGNSYLMITTNPDGSQHLKYLISPAATGGNRDYVMTYQVTGKPSPGVSYSLFSPTIGDVIGTNIQTAALGVAFYKIILNIDGVNYEAIVAYDPVTGKMVIISYTPI